MASFIATLTLTVSVNRRLQKMLKIIGPWGLQDKDCLGSGKRLSHRVLLQSVLHWSDYRNQTVQRRRHTKVNTMQVLANPEFWLWRERFLRTTPHPHPPHTKDSLKVRFDRETCQWYRSDFSHLQWNAMFASDCFSLFCLYVRNWFETMLLRPSLTLGVNWPLTG